MRTGNRQWSGSPVVILTDKVVSLFSFVACDTRRCQDTAVVIMLSYCMTQIVQAVSELTTGKWWWVGVNNHTCQVFNVLLVEC